WSDMPEADARANLRVALFNLRRLVADHLDIRRESVAFRLQSRYRLDVAEFEQLVGQLHEQGIDLAAAADNYRGEFLEGFHVRDAPLFEEWMLLQRERLRQIAMQLLYVLAQRAAEHGEYAAGIAYTSRLLGFEPWHEEAHRHLMLLLSLNGQRSAALEQYQICRRILAGDLGIDPTEETTALYRHIRSEQHRPAIHDDPGKHIPLMDRAEAHHALVHLAETARQRGTHMTLITGEAGSGKTRLATELWQYMAERGDRVIHGRCHTLADPPPFQVIVDALRSAWQQAATVFEELPAVWRQLLVPLIPELATSADGGMPSANESRQLLFEAVARCLIALSNTLQKRQLVILWLDDLHAADTATIDLLLFLVMRLEHEPIWILGTSRTEPHHKAPEVIRLQRALGREQRLSLVPLAPLSRAAVLAICATLRDVAPAVQAPTAEFLWHESQGNPFILSHLVSERIYRTPTPHVYQIPFAVEQLFLAQLDPLSPAARRILDQVALAETGIALTVLAGMHINDTWLAAITECFEHGLLRISSNDPHLVCDFAHPMLRRVVDSRLTPWQRRILTLQANAEHYDPAGFDSLLPRLVQLPHNLVVEP
ncbi:MAG TPA: BTAD domain-containing putative transcriptional regulator, partial [Roseiflexaceae bacterium]|nr:BTAD domain-containing putative transcriptional regulator [Roseiflexaceae bacterium]